MNEIVNKKANQLLTTFFAVAVSVCCCKADKFKRSVTLRIENSCITF